MFKSDLTAKQLDLPKSEAPSSSTLFASDIDAFLGKREQAGPINDLKSTQVHLHLYTVFVFFY